MIDPSVEALPLDVARCAAEVGLQAALRQEDPTAWDRTLAALRYIPVAYSGPWIDYQLAYQRGHDGKWWDISLLLHHDRRPCGVWPMSFSLVAGRASVTSHGFALLPPLFVAELPERSRKALIRGCLDLWEGMCRAVDIPAGESAESFSGQSEPGLSEWHRQSMRRGARTMLRHELFVDLSLSMEAIKAQFRKSYRALINSGMRTWQVGEMATANPALWDAFRDLHRKVSGRVTRCALSWQMQHQAIAEGNAFLIFLLDQHDTMVGGGFFSISRDEGVYAVGAYDRALFDKPLGHVVQYRAIEILKRRGVRWYRIGSRPYPSDLPAPSDKEISIAEFKQGFATHLFPQYVLHHEATSIEPR